MENLKSLEYGICDIVFQNKQKRLIHLKTKFCVVVIVVCRDTIMKYFILNFQT